MSWIVKLKPTCCQLFNVGILEPENVDKPEGVAGSQEGADAEDKLS